MSDENNTTSKKIRVIALLVNDAWQRLEKGRQRLGDDRVVLADRSFAEALEQIIKADLELRTIAADGGSDVSTLNSSGVPTLSVGFRVLPPGWCSQDMLCGCRHAAAEDGRSLRVWCAAGALCDCEICKPNPA